MQSIITTVPLTIALCLTCIANRAGEIHGQGY